MIKISQKKWGALAELQGSDFWAGAAGGATSSIISSTFIEVFGGSLNQTFNDIIVIIGGGLGGGYASHKAGGDFWLGFGYGVLAAGLNHVMHQQYKISRTNKALRDFAQEHFGKTVGFNRKNYSVKKPPKRYGLTDNPDGSWTKHDGKLALGFRAPNGKIYISQRAFLSFEDLYLVVGHESLHTALREIGQHPNIEYAHSIINNWELSQYALFFRPASSKVLNNIMGNSNKYAGAVQNPELYWQEAGFTLKDFR